MTRPRQVRRYLERLVVVVLLVGVLVVLGLGWRGSSLAGLISEGERDHESGLEREEDDDERGDRRERDDGFSLEGVGQLGGTMFAGAGAMVVVVGIDTVRRRRRPADPRRRPQRPG